MIATSTKRLILSGCIVLAALAVGCGGGGDPAAGWTLNNLVRKLLGPSPSQYVDMVLDQNDPDRRREGIIGLSKHDWGLTDKYLRGYAAILKTDRDPLVRAAAARALGKAKDPNYTGDVAAALFDESDAVRHDAAVALDGVVGEAAVEPLRKVAVSDTDQDVRTSCARALRHYWREDVVRTLVVCLSDKAFGVRHEAHASLVAVTGMDRGYEPENWADLALKALPPKPPQKASWWDRLWRRGGKPPPAPAGKPGG
jgi:hypothetical protein